VLSHPAEQRRPAMWPWLVMPLTTLALFFALKEVRHLPPRATGSTTQIDTSVPGPDSP
jgi:hypothetical protein